VGVGMLSLNEQRSFTLSVEAVPAKSKGPREPRRVAAGLKG